MRDFSNLWSEHLWSHCSRMYGMNNARPNDRKNNGILLVFVHDCANMNVSPFSIQTHEQVFDENVGHVPKTMRWSSFQLWFFVVWTCISSMHDIQVNHSSSSTELHFLWFYGFSSLRCLLISYFLIVFDSICGIVCFFNSSRSQINISYQLWEI